MRTDVRRDRRSGAVSRDTAPGRGRERGIHTPFREGDAGRTEDLRREPDL